MEARVCTDEYRPLWWKPSLAISAYEPKPENEDLPKELCDKRITFLKVTCSISGLTLSPSERRALISSANSIDIEPKLVEPIIDNYLGCYGVQLRVSVSPFDNMLYGVPHTKNTIDFGKFTTADRLSNPYLPNKFTIFEFPGFDHGEGKLIIVDKHPHPPNTDSKGELGLNSGSGTGRLVISIRQSTKVEAKVVLTGDIPGEIKMSAFYGDTLIGSHVTPSPQELDKVYTLEVLAPDIHKSIDKVIIETPNPTHVYSASLLEFSYYTPVPLEDYPRIVDFEPKKRELYQAGTEEGEILSASRSEINTSKSSMHSQTTETGWNVSGKLSYSSGQEGGPGAEVSGGYKNTTTDVDQTNLNVTVDASRERRERQSTSTNISQLYNLLSGYHIGSNEATFLMLPRPHTMQPTDKRSLIRGLRIIEGIQDFFLIVVRPKNIGKVAINAFLETGHFSEKDAETVEYDLSFEDFEVSHWAFQTPAIGASTFSSTHVVKEGYIIDYDAKEEDFGKRKILDVPILPIPFPIALLNPKSPDYFHRGVALIAKIICLRDPLVGLTPILLPGDAGGDRFNIRALPEPFDGNFRMLHHSYSAENAITVKVEGIAESDGNPASGGFVGMYRVFTRSEKPINDFNGKMVKLATGLCTAFESPENETSCLTPLPLNMSTRYIVDEPTFITSTPKVFDEQLIASRVYRSYLGQSEKTFLATGISEADPNLGKLQNEIGSNQSAAMNSSNMRMPYIKNLIGNIKIAMSSTSPYYDPSLRMTLLDTDYIKEKIKNVLPAKYLDQQAHKIPESKIFTNLTRMKDITIRGLLDMDLNSFAYKTKLEINDALKIRRKLLRIEQEEKPNPETIGGAKRKRNDQKNEKIIVKKKPNKKRH